MLSLSQTAGYAILALSCLAGPRGPLLLARQLVERAGVPLPYLSKILNRLAQRRLVRAKRGYRGGFCLARPAERISLLEVVEAVEGERWKPRCLLGLASCTDERACPTHKFWTVERSRIEAELRRLTLAEVAAFEARARRSTVAQERSDARSGGVGRNGRRPRQLHERRAAARRKTD